MSLPLLLLLLLPFRGRRSLLLLLHPVLLPLPLLLTFGSARAFSASQMDCQANEVFLECGTCEGNCKEPVIANCRKECKPPRCECQAKNGFVRSHDGACILASECGIYRGAYFGSSGNVISHTGSKPAPKTMSNNFHAVSGGAGFVPLGQSQGAGEGTEGEESREGRDDPDLSSPSPAPPSTFAPPLPSSRTPGPPSIKPPSAISRSLLPHQDQVVQTGPNPPVIWPPPRGEGHALGKSRMNLFADLANAGVTTELGLDGGETTPAPAAFFRGAQPHQSALPPHRSSTVTERRPIRFRPSGERTEDEEAEGQQRHRVLGEQEAGASPVAAKCGHHRCAANALATGASSAGQSQRTRPNHRHPYLYALMNRPSADEEADGSGGSDSSGLNDNQLGPPIPPLPANLRIFRGRNMFRQRIK